VTLWKKETVSNIFSTGSGKYVDPKIVCSFLSNRLELQNEILSTYLMTGCPQAINEKMHKIFGPVA